MNVYDFDGTIYDGDSSLDFYFFCLRKKPQIIYLLPYQVLNFFLFLFHFRTKTQFKSAFFYFLTSLKNVENLVSEFWDLNQFRIKEWYKQIQEDADCIISASPSFLLEEICNRNKINNLIATNMNKLNGKIYGENCSSKYKVEAFKRIFPNEQITNFYSDSKSDVFLASMADNSYFVRGNQIIEWKL